MVSVANSGEKRTASDFQASEPIVSKVPKIGNFTLAETLLKRSESTVSSAFSEVNSSCSVTSALTKPEVSNSTSQQKEREVDPFESIQEWLNSELSGKTEIEPEFRCDSPIFDDWDDIAYDSNEDDDLDFLDSLSPPDKSLDGQSIPGSEGYGTDTSDLYDLLSCQSSLEKPCLVTTTSLTSENIKKTVIEVSKSTEETSKLVTFTSNQTVSCSGKVSTDNKPRIITLKDNRIQGKVPKEAKITRVYQIPSINGGSTVASKVGTQTRKTVVVKVLKPKNGIIRVKKADNTMAGTRASLKMQLQRDRIIQEEKQNLQTQIVSSSGKSTSSAVNLPAYVVTKPTLPAQILKVETGLQNPTRYHVIETQRNQVKEFLSQSHDGSKYIITRQVLAPPSSAPTGGQGDGHHVGIPASPLARLNISTSADNMNDIIDDIVSLESSLGEDHRAASTLSTVSPSELNRFSTTAGTKLPIIIRENVSSSCPVIKQEITEEDIRLFTKDRMKKDNHNIIERRRRYNINDRIKELGHMVPKSLDPEMKWNKGSILKATVDYVRSLQSEQTRYRKVEQRNKEMETLNKKLLLRVQELESTLKQHGVNVAVNQTEQQQIVNVLVNNPSVSSAPTFTNEEERLVSNFPSTVISSPAPSPVVMVTQPQAPVQRQEMMPVQQGTSQTTFQLSPQPQQQTYQQPQQLITVDVNALSPEQQQQLSNVLSPQQPPQQQHLSPNQSYSQFIYSPSPESNVVSPNPLNMGQDPLQSSEPNISLGMEAIPQMDISNFDFDTPTNADLTTIEGGFGALLASGNTDANVFNDVMMDDDLSLIKTSDMFLNDASN